MPFDEYGETGDGTLEEYFTHKPTSESFGNEVTEALDKEFWADIDSRDNAIDRLCLQLFSEFSGLPETEHINVFWPEDMRGVRNRARRKGAVLIGWQPDDPILALYKDGEPIAAFYASYRGMYQAGGYVAVTDKAYFAHNFLPDSPQDTWEERGAVCSDIARSFLLFERTY